MNIKLLIAIALFSVTVLGFAVQSFADKAASSVKNKNIVEEIPQITNEAEYAEFVRKRDRAGQASSVKVAQSITSAASSRSKANNH